MRAVRAALVAGLLDVLAAQTGWVALSTSVLPPARRDHAMASRGSADPVVFGGYGASGPLGDTWEFDGRLWHQLALTGPSPRDQHAMAFDRNRNEVVLFGGFGSSGLLGDTWLLQRPNAWLLRSSAGPSPRRGHAMAYDDQRSAVVLYGGNDGSGPLDDTWQMASGVGGNWARLSIAIVPPPARERHAMTYDPDRRVVVMFGGERPGGRLADTWSFDGTAWTLLATTGPSARSDHSLGYDVNRRRVVLFGGATQFAHLGDTWEGRWPTTSTFEWSPLPVSSPPARGQHAAAWLDGSTGRIVMFGGDDGSLRDDTWQWFGLPTAAASTYGIGCGSPPLTLASVRPPYLGSTAQATLTNVPSTFAFVALGRSRTAIGATPLPFSLAAFGLPGCNLLQSADVPAIGLPIVAQGVADIAIQVPNNPILAGTNFYLQGWAPAPGVNAANTIVSNGLQWRDGT